ncbi:MAG: prolipoprotein diacylglyceryl transferase [Firmicutes bacterium]|nr:prolipoprotein diacylglyceryl transferase [Bacillota bacterium]
MFPVLFRLGGYNISAYGVMLAGAFVLCTACFVSAGGRSGLAREKLWDLALLATAAALAASRLLYVLLALPVYKQNLLSLFDLRHGGLSFFGALAGGTAAGLWYAMRHGLPPGKILDLAAPFLALGYALVRIGCFLNGCCFGLPSELPWALPAAAADNLPRHPVQLYAAAAGLVLFLLLLMRRRQPGFPGRLFLEFILYYCSLRFSLEFFRETDDFWGSLTMAQAAALAGVAAASAAILVRPRLMRRRR